MSALEAALECAARGWLVFPCNAEKNPTTDHGFKDASCNPDEVRRLFRERPGPMVGMATGASGLVVLDLDCKNGAPGLDEWAELRKELGKAAEDTTLVETPSGGMHVYYQANGARIGSSIGKLAPGIDIRAEGGYVIAAGSPGYLYVDGHGPERIRKVPALLSERLSFAPKTTDAPADVIPEGQRDSTLTSLAGTMRRRGMTEEEILAALQVANRTRCRPPLADKQVGKIARSVGRYEPAPEPDVPLPPVEPATVQPPELASCRDILSAFASVIVGRGVIGEDRFAQTVYLALTSRVLSRPVSIAAKGPSSAGKSYVVEQVVDFFPASAYYALSSMSEHALAYSQEPLAHRFLILYEAAGLESDFASYLLRSLLSEGCIRYETVEKVKGKGMVPRLIEREGPTGLIVTTTQVSLHPENETRLLSVPANDSAEQTKKVMLMTACEDDLTGDDELVEWRQLQEYISGADNRVVVPFARELAQLVPPVAVRLRRDFTTVLTLVKAHALLHQLSRDRDDAGRIVATVDDYAVVRALVADLVADEVGATVPAATVETVGAVADLASRHEGGVTYLQLGERLRLDKSAAMRRAKVAVSRGYLKNLETRRGQPAKLVIGEPLPGDMTILPLPADVAAACRQGVAAVDAAPGCTVARLPEGIDTTAVLVGPEANCYAEVRP